MRFPFHVQEKASKMVKVEMVFIASPISAVALLGRKTPPKLDGEYVLLDGAKIEISV